MNDTKFKMSNTNEDMWMEKDPKKLLEAIVKSSPGMFWLNKTWLSSLEEQDSLDFVRGVEEHGYLKLSDHEENILMAKGGALAEIQEKAMEVMMSEELASPGVQTHTFTFDV